MFQEQLGEKPLAVGQDQQQFGLDIRECPVAGEQEERLSGESREEVVEFAAERLFGLPGRFCRKILHFLVLRTGKRRGQGFPRRAGIEVEAERQPGVGRNHLQSRQFAVFTPGQIEQHPFRLRFRQADEGFVHVNSRGVRRDDAAGAERLHHFEVQQAADQFDDVGDFGGIRLAGRSEHGDEQFLELSGHPVDAEIIVVVAPEVEMTGGRIEKRFFRRGR